MVGRCSEHWRSWDQDHRKPSEASGGPLNVASDFRPKTRGDILRGKEASHPPEISGRGPRKVVEERKVRKVMVAAQR